MKPDWKDAPLWANYLAMDMDGEWCWYENEPLLAYDYWNRSSGSEYEYVVFKNWKETLQKKPLTV